MGQWDFQEQEDESIDSIQLSTPCVCLRKVRKVEGKWLVQYQIFRLKKLSFRDIILSKSILQSKRMKNGTGKNFFYCKKITNISFFFTLFFIHLTRPKGKKIQIHEHSYNTEKFMKSQLIDYINILKALVTPTAEQNSINPIVLQVIQRYFLTSYHKKTQNRQVAQQKITSQKLRGVCGKGLDFSATEQKSAFFQRSQTPSGDN